MSAVCEDAEDAAATLLTLKPVSMSMHIAGVCFFFTVYRQVDGLFTPKSLLVKSVHP